jgi:prophage regulatory protein
MTTTVSQRAGRRSAIADRERRGVQRLLSLVETCKRVGRSRWWVRDEVTAGRFPKPVSYGSRAVMFVEHEIDAWIEKLIEQRDRGAA